MHRDTVPRFWSPMSCPSSAAITVFQHDNAQPQFARICTQFLESENVPVLPWPAYSPDMSPIEHVRDGLDRSVRQRVPVPTNIQQLCTAIEEEWDNILLGRWRCVALYKANGFFLILCLVLWSTPLLFFLKGICDQQMHICIPSHVKPKDLGPNSFRP